ncbi:MFS transporter [Oceanobacillus neutriphilus]|uniref:MFS transporter n=1 Tax=Oceanobacillus neutriphilus TaxID=531815 RepID=A0ABQ2P2C4_9BACI|nr:MFS transporter [Oceanobacillus neutriphilus]GGP16336.1 MFS transporter [Oceanobacillus neutriphilus]
MRALFANRNYMLLWTGLSVSRFGYRFFNLAVLWFVMQGTGSALSLGMTVLCFTVPTIIIEPLAGVAADRFDRKKIMVFSDFFTGSIMLIIAVLMINDSLTLPLLYALLVCSAASMALFNPSANSSIPLLVEEEQLTKANSLNQLSTQGSNILGPALSGILIGLVGNIGFLLIISGVAFIISAITESWIKVPSVISREKEGKQSFASEMLDGFQYVVEDKALLFLVIVGGIIINFFLAPLTIFFTYMSDNVFDVGASGLGFINSILAVGAMCGSLMIMFNVFKDKYRMAVAGLLLEGIALLIMGIALNYYATVAAAGLLGLGVCFASVGLNTMYQTMIPKEMMGRVLSLVSMMLGASVPLGQLFGSLIIEHYSMAVVLMTFGVIVSISSLSLIRVVRVERKEDAVIERGAR